MKTVEERLKSYEPLWENWTYSGEFLGEGAMSSVFEIESTAMGFREVAALKIVTVQKNFRGEVKIPENALNEIKILRDLSGCPNIVHYHDSTQRQIFDDDGNLSEIDILIKMEKLQSLRDDEKLTEEQIIRLAKHMCTALIHANEHGIIHRDIKPQNIFVDSEGTYKLGDFGIAKIVSDFSDLFTMNIGTLAYSAPEIRSTTMRTYDIASDVYSLGLVLYVFLNNGQLPFANVSSTLNEAIAKRLSGAPFPSPARGSKNLKSIIMRACNADLSKRYKTPDKMLEDLELLSTGGKKMVVDPFATLDANIDAADIEEYLSSGKASSIASSSSFAESSSKKGGLRINMSKSTTDKSAEINGDAAYTRVVSDLAPKSRLRINMGSAATSKTTEDTATVMYPTPTPVASPVPTPVARPAEAPSMEPASTGSRLKINMGPKRTSDAPADAPTTEKKS